MPLRMPRPPAVPSLLCVLLAGLLVTDLAANATEPAFTPRLHAPSCSHCESVEPVAETNDAALAEPMAGPGAHDHQPAANERPDSIPQDRINAGPSTRSGTDRSKTLAPAAFWDIKLSDVRLDRALQRWAQQAGYSFRWDADRYLMVAAPARYSGTLEDAIRAVLSTPGIRESSYPLEACLYANQPPLLRITRLGDQSEYCH